MKILLINPPSSSYRQPEEHLGLGYLASVARKMGHEVEIIDAYLEGLSVDEVIERVTKIKFELVGFTFSMSSYDQFKVISERILTIKPKVIQIAGGYTATFDTERVLRETAIRIIVRGEGEETLKELLSSDALNKINLLKQIKGISFLSRGKVVSTDSRPLIENLDEIPFPARDTMSVAVQKKALVQILGSRGCYGNCSFCSINSLYKIAPRPCSKMFGTWRGRDPKKVVDELEILVKKHGATNIKFIDDCFFGPGNDWEKNAWTFIEEIKKRKIKFRFRISTRVNNVNRELFMALKDVGLYSLSLGVESGNQNSLNRFNKGLTVEQNINAVRILNDLGIIVMMGFIGFEPYITFSEVIENYKFLEKYCSNCVTNKVSLSLFAAEDTQITKKIIQDGLIKNKVGTNYNYDFIDKKVRKVHDFLVNWNVINEDLYHKTIDPLSSPRDISIKNQKIVHKLIKKLRRYDLEAFKYALTQTKNNLPLGKNELDALVDKYTKKWESAQKAIDRVYAEEGY